MSAGSDNSENRKKLFFTFGLLGIILIAFIAIVFVSNYIGLLDGIEIPFIGGHAETMAATVDTIHNDITTSNGITLTSMKKSVNLVTATSDGHRWAAANPDWYLYNARADYVNGQGLAQHWTVALQTDSSILVAVLNNGKVSSVVVHDILQDPAATANEADIDGTEEIVEQYPEANTTQTTPRYQPNIFDTGNAMSLALKETGVSLPQSSMPFSLVYENKDDLAAYTIKYTDAVTPQRSFIVQLDAVTGHILRSDRGVSK
jgi:hypothetical protein